MSKTPHYGGGYRRSRVAMKFGIAHQGDDRALRAWAHHEAACSTHPWKLRYSAIVGLICIFMRDDDFDVLLD